MQTAGEISLRHTDIGLGTLDSSGTYNATQRSPSRAISPARSFDIWASHPTTVGQKYRDPESMKTFNPSSKHPERAVQAWQILVGVAMNRQTLTYELLSQLMYKKKAAGVLDRILGHIAYYCNENKLPPLTSVVVGKGRGTPGDEIPMNPQEFDARREDVYAFDWYDVYPPSALALKEAFEKNAS